MLGLDVKYVSTEAAFVLVDMSYILRHLSAIGRWWRPSWWSCLPDAVEPILKYLLEGCPHHVAGRGSILNIKQKIQQAADSFKNTYDEVLSFIAQIFFGMFSTFSPS